MEQEEERKQAKNRLAALEAARRVKAHKRKVKRQKAKEAKRVRSESPLSEEQKLYQPHEEPAFFDFMIEKRHADHLG